MDLQPLTDLAHGQRARPAERQQHEHLVAGEGEAEGSEQRLDPAEEYLLHAHNRGDHGHTVGCVGPPTVDPLASGFRHRIEVAPLPLLHVGGRR